VWPSSISGSTSRQRPAGPSHTSAISWSISQPSKKYLAKPTRARDGIPLCRAMETNSTVKSRQQPTSRCLGGRAADSGRSASSPSRANIAAAYRVSISLIRSAATPFSAQSPSAQ